MKKANKLSILVCLILLSTSALDPFVFANTIDEETSASVEETIASDAVLSPDLSVEEPTDEAINSGQEDDAFNETSESNVSETSSSSEETSTGSADSGEINASSNTSETIPKGRNFNITSNQEDINNSKSLSPSGTWGTAEYTYEEATGTIIIGPGRIDGTDTAPPPWKNETPNLIKKIVFTGPFKIIGSASGMFQSLTELGSIEGMKNLDTTETTAMSSMFFNCRNLKELDLSSFDTKSVRQMILMFANMEKLEKLDISGINNTDRTSVWVNMIFSGSRSLKELTLGPKFKFGTNPNLGSPKSEPNQPNTGKWIKEDGSTASYTPSEFTSKYGTGELTAGTYIGEPVPSKLTSAVAFDKEIGIIGEKLSSTTTIKNISKIAVQNISVTIKNFMDSNLQKQEVFEFDKEIIIKKYDSTNKLLVTKNIPFTSDAISLEDLPVNYYYTITVSGKVWNTSIELPDGNYEIDVHYKDPEFSELRLQENKGFLPIKSGSFGFSSVPEDLPFEDTVLTLPVKETIINRKLSSWSVT
ncbi:bacterial surface protein 26-residue repeat protein, partial [Enterococcus sp. C1]|uniref:BspA family leucine-rich repeat surface protein n=1 Tax=Enterococcus sp. C1 TaxID=1182762 RepID=UPI0002721E59